MSIRYDSKIKKPFEEYEYTQEEILELVKCQNNIYEFFKYIKVVHPDQGLVTFIPRDYQEEIISLVQDNRFCIVLAARQVGKCIFFTSTVKIRYKKLIEEMIYIGEFFKKFNKSKIKYINNKFIESIDINDYEVWTDSGWKSFTGIGKTEIYQIYYIKLDNGLELKCADDHLVFDLNHNEIKVKNLYINDFIQTELGLSKVISIDMLNEYDNMYDLLNVDGEKYYTNNVLSHNSLTVSALAMHYICFNSNKVVGIASNKERSAIKLLGVIRKMYEELPNWLKPGVKYYAKTYIEFDNGSKIIVSATSPDAFRGESINCLILDEFSSVPKNVQDEFYEANYPTISASEESKIIIISTPKGLFNLFHELYSGAEKNSNDFKHLKISWERIPGRDKKWAEEQIRNIGPVKFAQEFSCDFLGSVNTVIDIGTLRQITNEFEYPVFRDLNDSLLIYEKPILGCNYIIGVDVAKGTGNDYSTMQILKLESVKPVKLTQVASFNNNLIDVYKFSEVLLRTAIYYNKAFVLCENNGEGSAIVNKLWWDYEYSNLVNSGNKRTDLGIRASKKTKPLAVMLLKKLIEDRSLVIKDIETLNQLTDFKEKSNGSFACENMHDDLISALYWAVYIFELNILDEDMEFIKVQEEENEVWGILADINIDPEESWEWLTAKPEKDQERMNSLW